MPSGAIQFAFIESRLRFRRTAASGLFVSLAMQFLFLCSAAVAEGPVRGRELTRGEGLAVVEAISEHRVALTRHGAKPDCSHLVNNVYGLAGFPYLYAKSSDLYRGHRNFVRVKSPQPGDMIVWRGHVGLVTDPREHLFYSSLRSGLDVEDYTSAYWKRHGTPRFYRYRITNDQPYLLAPETTVGQSEQKSNANVKTLSVKQSAGERRGDFLTGASDTTWLSSSNKGDSLNFDASALLSMPTEFLVTAEKPKPSIEKVNEAVSRMIQSCYGAAEAQNLLRSASTIVIFTKLQVNQLQFKSNRGWADISIDSRMYLTRGELHKTARHDKEHWEIVRSDSGWNLVARSGITYLSRTDATRIFAQQLARLTENRESESSNALVSEEGNLASILNGLLTN